MISATHRDLPAEISNGKFREDLYYRLHVVTFELPSLREQKEDISLLLRISEHSFAACTVRELARPHARDSAAKRWPLSSATIGRAMCASLKTRWSAAWCFVAATKSASTICPRKLQRAKRWSGARVTNGADVGLGENDFREAKHKFEVAYLTNQLNEPPLECFAHGGDDWSAPSKFAGKTA